MSWDGLIEMFNPGHKHFAEERDRKRIEARIAGTEGEPLVDLDAGTVTLVGKRATAPAPADAQPDEDGTPHPTPTPA